MTSGPELSGHPLLSFGEATGSHRARSGTQHVREAVLVRDAKWGPKT